jgi:hypothetical protein
LEVCAACFSRLVELKIEAAISYEMFGNELYYKVEQSREPSLLKNIK